MCVLNTSFKASLLSNIQGEVGKSTANWIGDQGIKFDAANSPLVEAGKIAAHGMTSGAIAEITGGNFAAGAAGGAMSELASSWSMQAFDNPEHQVALNKLLGGLAASAVTGDENNFDTGADRAETVHRYNYLSHQQKAQRDKELSNCTPPKPVCKLGLNGLLSIWDRMGALRREYLPVCMKRLKG